MPRQVVRGSNDDNAQVIGHADRDHVARDAATETNPGVVSAGDDVGQRRIGRDFEDDLRILRDKAGEQGPSTKEATGGEATGGATSRRINFSIRRKQSIC
jgi:hypothetical protein